MTLYVVLPAYDYEGYGQPILITEDEEKAQACAEKLDKEYDAIDIVTYELDKEY